MHKSTHGFDFWDNYKEQIIQMYSLENMSANKIAKKFQCDPTTIIRQLKRWNVPIHQKRCNSIYDLDCNFFDNIDSEEKAYILGLLLSDGHIAKNNTIMLTLKDKDVIEKYRKAIKSNAPIKIDKYGNYQLNIRCKTMAQQLRKIGLNNRKSYELDFNKILSYISKSLENHFVRGLFDGDGSIKIYYYSYLKNPQYHFGYTGLKNVVDYVKDYLDIHTKTVKESNITYTCVSSCKDTIKHIYQVLYNNATIYMDRKYETFIKII